MERFKERFKGGFEGGFKGGFGNETATAKAPRY